MRKGTDRIGAFLFTPDSSAWLTILRIGLGVYVIVYCLTIRADWSYLFAESSGALINRKLSEAMIASDSPLIPQLSWIMSDTEALGVSEARMLPLVWVALLLAGCTLAAGLLSRLSAVVSWFLHLAAAKSGGLLSYGADSLLTIGLFYLILAPLPDRWSIDCWLRRRQCASEASSFIRRLLQLHLCLIYFFGGLMKSLGRGWWDGSNLWRAFTRPPFDLLPREFIARWGYLLPLLGIAIFALEISYPLLVWLHRTRLPALTAICLMHAAIGLTMGMHLFALVMIVLNLAAFGPADSWCTVAQPKADPRLLQAS